MKQKILTIIKILIIIIVLAIILVPFWDLFINSFKTSREAAIPSLNLPTQWQVVENYGTVIEKGNLLRAFKNSMIITLGSAVLILATSTMAAYVFGRRKDRGVRFVFFIFIFAIITPPSFILSVLLLNSLNLIGSYWGMIFFYGGTFMALPVFLITGFVSTIPRELEEAAIIDGATPMGVFTRIMLPLLKPAIATSAIYIILKVWNDFIGPLYILSGNTKKYTMILSLYLFKGQFDTQWNLVFADLVMVMLPVLIAFIFAQKYIVKGLTAGAIKG